MPVLYARGARLDGRPVDMTKILRVSDSQIPRTPITVEEHPGTGDAYYCLHPCETLRIMDFLMSGSAKDRYYLLSWLSLMSDIMGVRPFRIL